MISRRRPLFELRHVTKTFGERTVLSDISLTVKPGQWIGILGESGSGKSTLLQIAGRYTDADSGLVYLNHVALPPVSSQLLKGHPSIKLVHQDYHLFPNQTVAENIFYPMRLHPQMDAPLRTEILITLAGLTDVQHQKTKLLSGGQKQRTAIAAAIAEVPLLLLLDEPFSHLDALNRARLFELFQALKKEENQTCLFVTHDPTEALDWADHLVVLKHGAIVQEGVPYEIYEHPVNGYVAALTGKINWLDEARTTFLRPERVRVSYRETASTRHRGQIAGIHFKGTHWEYEVGTDTGLLFLVYRRQNDLAAGQKIYLSYPKDAIRSFRSDVKPEGNLNAEFTD